MKVLAGKEANKERRDRKERQGGREECLGRNGGVVRKIREWVDNNNKVIKLMNRNALAQ